MTANFPSLPPCAFRRVSHGQTLCLRATDEFDQPVWPEVCARCPVPTWLAGGICRHLDIGTDVGPQIGAKSPRVFVACRFFNTPLEGLERCQRCPEFSLWEAGQEKGPSAEQMLAESVPQELLEQAVQEAMDRHVRRERPRMMVQCFRAGVEKCLYSPALVPNWVLVLPPPSLRPLDPYRSLIAEVLKEGQMEGLFFLGPLKDIDSLCDLCLGVQRAPRLVVDLSEWDNAALTALALGGALGRSLLLIRGRDSTPPFVPQGFPVNEYGSGQELAMTLVRGLGIPLRPAEGERKPEPTQPAGEQPTPMEEEAGEETAEGPEQPPAGTGETPPQPRRRSRHHPPETPPSE